MQPHAISETCQDYVFLFPLRERYLLRSKGFPIHAIFSYPLKWVESNSIVELQHIDRSCSVNSPLNQNRAVHSRENVVGFPPRDDGRPSFLNRIFRGSQISLGMSETKTSDRYPAWISTSTRLFAFLLRKRKRWFSAKYSNYVYPVIYRAMLSQLNLYYIIQVKLT